MSYENPRHNGIYNSAFFGLLLRHIWDFFQKPLPIFTAVISGSFFSIWFSFSKKITSKYPSVELNTLGYVAAVIVNYLIAFSLKEPLNINFSSAPWLANFGYGIAGFIGSGLTVYGFKFISAHKGSLILLSEIIFGTLFGILLFHESLNLTTLLGGILIILSLALPEVYQLKN